MVNEEIPSMSGQLTNEIYDQNAQRWSRTTPVLLSDFTARPRVLDALGNLEGDHVLDLGCGEGYVARLIAARGASSVFGIDQSSEMIQLAQAHSHHPDCSLHFITGDAVSFGDAPRDAYDKAIAVFLFNYLTRAQMTAVMKRARSLLVQGGRFVFTVPHPCLPFMRPHEEPFYFNAEEANYFDGVDRTFEGEIWNRGQGPVPVRCVHKTFGDYFVALREAGFTTLPQITELTVTDEHIKLDPSFFGPLRGSPLHVLFQVDL